MVQMVCGSQDGESLTLQIAALQSEDPTLGDGNYYDEDDDGD